MIKVPSDDEKSAVEHYTLVHNDLVYSECCVDVFFPVNMFPLTLPLNLALS